MQIASESTFFQTSASPIARTNSRSSRNSSPLRSAKTTIFVPSGDEGESARLRAENEVMAKKMQAEGPPEFALKPEIIKEIAAVTTAMVLEKLEDKRIQVENVTATDVADESDSSKGSTSSAVQVHEPCAQPKRKLEEQSVEDNTRCLPGGEVSDSDQQSQDIQEPQLSQLPFHKFHARDLRKKFHELRGDVSESAVDHGTLDTPEASELPLPTMIKQSRTACSSVADEKPPNDFQVTPVMKLPQMAMANNHQAAQNRELQWPPNQYGALQYWWYHGGWYQHAADAAAASISKNEATSDTKTQKHTDAI
jgi:hypothetical protein